MPELDLNSLKKQLSAGELQSLYLVIGEEKYLVSQTAARIIKAAGAGALSDFNDRAFTDDSTVDSIADAAEVLPLMAEHKCVSVSDYNVEERKDGEFRKLRELLENVPETSTLVFWYPTQSYSGPRWQTFLKLCREKGCVIKCEHKSAGELQKMLIRMAEKENCVLSPGNAARIVEYAGRDVGRLLTEMEKLIAYTLGTGESEISAGAIEDLVPRNIETTVFILSNALLSGNFEKAYEVLDALFYLKEEPVRILGALVNSYVDMLRVQTALESGRSPAGAADYGEYNKDKARTGYRLDMAAKNAKRAGAETVRKSLELLLEADMTLKSSQIDEKLVLEELIAKLLLAAQRGPA